MLGGDVARLSAISKCYDTTTGEVSQRQVTATFERRSDHLNYLTIIDATGKEQTLETTDGHPFWVVTDTPDLNRAARDTVLENGTIIYHENIEPGLNGFWVEAKDLRVGDVLLGANGELSVLVDTYRIEFAEDVAVYNFSVEGNHNYFVLAKEYDYGQTCVLVHNANIAGYTKHGLNQAISRDGVGVSQQAILNAVKNPIKTVSKNNGVTKHVGNNATVVLNNQNQVITTWATNSSGFRIAPPSAVKVQ